MDIWWIVLAVLGAIAVALGTVALLKLPSSIYKNAPDELNPVQSRRVEFVPDENDPVNADGERGHLVSVGEAKPRFSIYERVVKRIVDILLSFFGLLISSPVLIGVAVAIIIDDPGPVLFTQKRVGLNKRYFKMHKFRSMKMSTPHDIPTHMLGDPKQYITRVGRFIRATSLDELPQIWDIFIGNMSIVGPRPALWNQDILTAERDKYGANDTRPGLTGWAQINGRDELLIPEKAKLDGDYTAVLKKGGMKAFLFDCRCFFGSIFPVAAQEGVLEGGTGEIQKNNKQ